MNILITAATNFEIQNIKRQIKTQKNSVDFCVTGIGCVATTYNLLKKIYEKNFNLIINAGIAGTFNTQIKIGDVVIVETETFGDLGIEYPEKFTTLFEENLIGKNEMPFTNEKLICKHVNNFDFDEIKKVNAITVNTTSGNKQQIYNISRKFNPDIETMEGAAFFYVCIMQNIPFVEIRAISNIMEPRNKNNWDTELALKNLANYLTRKL